MNWTTALYEYDGSFDGFLCCVFDSYIRRERPLAILCGAQEQTSLETIHSVETQPAHARRVAGSIQKCAPAALSFLRRAFLTCLPEKELLLYRLICRLYDEGPAFLHDPTDPTMYPICRALRHLSGELEKLRGFVRFSAFGGIYAAEIAPKNRVLPALRPHFCARFADQPFLIYDRTHKEALLHAGGRWTIVPMEQFSMALPDETEARYRKLWKTFCDTVAIQSRRNARCQRSHLPLRYRTDMTEFQGEEYFTPAEAPQPAGAAQPSVGGADGLPELFQRPFLQP